MLSSQKALFARDCVDLNLRVEGFQGKLYSFQRKDIAYLFFMQKALNANQTGTGKTIEIIGLNCLQSQYRRLKGHVQVVPAQSLLQWYQQYRQFAPHLIVRPALGRPVDRIGTYNAPYDVLLVSYHTLWHDWQYILTLGYNSISFDEASFYKNPDSKTADIVKAMSAGREWVIPMTATPIQNCVGDLWSIYQPLHMEGLLGSRAYFMNRYTVEETQQRPNGRGKLTNARVITAYKNLGELQERIKPFYVRRLVSDPEVAASMPEVVHDVRWLELRPEQNALYDEAKNQILRNTFRGRELRSRFHQLKKIVDGTQTLDSHYVDISCKSDEVMGLLQGDLAQDKVVLFSWYKANIYSLSERLKQARIEHEFIWGDEPDKVKRFQVQKRFHEDPTLRVILGTTALEMSLNLQAARYLIFYDLLYNPSRNLQVIGRIRRLGSQYGTCIVISLLAKDTLEERLWDKVQQRAAISDYVFDETVGEEVFDKLTDDALYSLIRS